MFLLKSPKDKNFSLPSLFSASPLKIVKFASRVIDNRTVIAVLLLKTIAALHETPAPASVHIFHPVIHPLERSPRAWR
jgi:hypothetical protein